MAQLNWDDLRYFLAVAGAGSLSGAAVQLGVNTTTVLRRVSSLEDDLGTRLFERERTGYKLTAAGEKLVESLEPVDRRLTSLPRDFAADAGSHGTVRLAAEEPLASRMIGADLGLFRAAHPTIELELVAEAGAGASLLAPRVTNPLRDVDVMIRAARPTSGDMLMRKVGELGFGLYAAAAYLDARGWPPESGALAGHDVIGFASHEPPLGPVWWLSRMEKGAEVVFRSTSGAARAEAAAQGLGLAVLPCLAGDADPRLVRVFGPQITGALELWLLTRNDLAQLAHVRAVMDFVVDCVKRHRSALEGQTRQIVELPRPSRAG